METIKITKGQPFVLWIPTIMLNADGEQAVDAGTLTDVVVEVTNGCEAKSVVFHAFEHWLVLEFGNDLNVGPCSIRIRGVLESGRAFSLALSKPVEIVNWDKESNWDRFIIGDHIELTDHPFITGAFLTDAEYEELKAKLRQSIAAAEQAEEEAQAAKEEYDRKAEMLDDVAKETSSQEIKQLIINEGIEHANEYAQQINEIIGDWTNE